MGDHREDRRDDPTETRRACYTLVSRFSVGISERVMAWLIDDPLGTDSAKDQQAEFLRLFAERLDDYRRAEWVDFLETEPVPDLVREIPTKTDKYLVFIKPEEHEKDHQDRRPLLRSKPIALAVAKELLFDAANENDPLLQAAAFHAMAQLSQSALLRPLTTPINPLDRPLPQTLENALRRMFLHAENSRFPSYLTELDFDGSLKKNNPDILTEYDKSARSIFDWIRGQLNAQYKSRRTNQSQPETLLIFCWHLQRLKPFISSLYTYLTSTTLGRNNNHLKIAYNNLSNLRLLADCLLPSGVSIQEQPTNVGKQAPRVASQPSTKHVSLSVTSHLVPVEASSAAPPEESSAKEPAPAAAAEEQPSVSPTRTQPEDRADGRTAPTEQPSTAPEDRASAAAPRPENGAEKAAPPPPEPALLDPLAELARRFDGVDKLVQLCRDAEKAKAFFKDRWASIVPIAVQLLTNLERKKTALMKLADDPAEDAVSQSVSEHLFKLADDLLPPLVRLDSLLCGVTEDGRRPLAQGVPQAVIPEVKKLRDLVYDLMSKHGGYEQHPVHPGDNPNEFRDEYELKILDNESSGHRPGSVAKVVRPGYLKNRGKIKRAEPPLVKLAK